MRSIRFTIASLIVAVAVVALDIVWLKSLMTTHRSVFGFAVEGLDMGLFLMANVLPFGLYAMLSRRGEGRRYLVGFEVGGLAATLAYAGWAWLAPGALDKTAHFIFDPVWYLLFGWVGNKGILALVIMLVFLIVGLGAPQLLVAVLFGVRARRSYNRGVHATSADARPANAIPSTQPS
jgi:hypothetical protein